jgi:hypothetical protein
MFDNKTTIHDFLGVTEPATGRSSAAVATPGSGERQQASGGV